MSDLPDKLRRLADWLDFERQYGMRLYGKLKFDLNLSDDAEAPKQVRLAADTLDAQAEEVAHYQREIDYQREQFRHELEVYGLKFEALTRERDQFLKVIADGRALEPPPPIIIQSDAAMQAKLDAQAREVTITKAKLADALTTAETLLARVYAQEKELARLSNQNAALEMQLREHASDLERRFIASQSRVLVLEETLNGMIDSHNDEADVTHVCGCEDCEKAKAALTPPLAEKA